MLLLYVFLNFSKAIDPRPESYFVFVRFTEMVADSEKSGWLIRT